MSRSAQGYSVTEGQRLSFKERLGDILTLSRVFISLVVLSLSFVGKDAYVVVVILVIIGGITDILDGKLARRYLGERGEGKLGRHDPEIDTFLVLCTLAYFSLSHIVIPTIVGLGWIAIAVTVIFAFRRQPRVLLGFEIPSILAVIAIAALYDLTIFVCVVLPALAIGVMVNYKRVRYLLFDYFPRIFSTK